MAGPHPARPIALLSNETAYQTLEKRSATEVYWSRGGSAPEVLSVAFDQATFLGSTFTAVGSGTRVDPLAGDWRLSGISPGLPLSGQIRARARTASGYLSGSTGIMESKVAYIHSLPVVTTVSVTSITGTTALLTGTVDTSALTATPAFKLDNTTAYTQPLRIGTPAGITGTGTFTALVTGLTPGTAYVFRATAENAGGRADGTDKTFTTLSNLNAIYNIGTEVPASAASYVATGRNVTFTLNYAPTPGTTLMVVNNTDSTPITGSFSNLAQGQPVDLTFGGVTYPYVAHYYGGNGNDLVLLWRHTRALSWGWNNLGQLGNGNSFNRGIPGELAGGLLNGKTIVSMSGGFQHSVALCVDGTIATWGDNLDGQLGNGDSVERFTTVPTTVEQAFLPAGIHPVAISAGGSHTLSLFSDGRVYAWGDNEHGQVGNGSSVFDENLPVPAAGALSGRRVIGISAGEFHSLAVCDDGFVAAWGLGDSGQLGNGDTANSKSPVAVDLSDVPPGEKFVAVAAGRWHSMALTSGGKVFTWGHNQSGQLGDGTTDNQKYPILVPGLTATAIYGGGTYHSLALRNDGKLMAWGTNIYGQLGTGNFLSSSTPAALSSTWLGGQSLAATVSGDEHNLAMRSDGKLFAWGLGNEGRLGNNNIDVHTQPTQQPVDATALDPGDRWQGLFSGTACQHSLAIIAVSLEPSATTLPAFVISDTEAILYGRVNAHGRPTDLTFDHGLTSGYGSSTNATPPTLDTITPTVVSAALTGLIPGRTYHYQVNAAQGLSYTPGGDLTFTTFTRLQMWRNDYFGTVESAEDSADNADPDNDGVANLTEFAFGLNPLQPDAAALPQHVVDGSLILLEFTEPDTHMGITYSAEWSPDMSPGSWSALPDKGAGPVHSFKFSTAGSDRGFLRLKATVTSP
jgi:alpha-tubulin suppressor-like RCC1 family protein